MQKLYWKVMEEDPLCLKMMMTSTMRNVNFFANDLTRLSGSLRVLILHIFLSMREAEFPI
ncbi:hypothetical protein AT2G41355 [Arabidopsis thaliana]|uniref:Uncharacterized protein n=2 Tax=Arabidopsis thaliana TaxID=3702 RepID=A0A5S9X618_ARATH|nr:uncharacterized protein AT2G41355 [Arabidopsis thaliana]ANM61496.1 hypothetical protein AT2G41355 [Arabidopsis thaliana]CAA0376141.1 unnamed protein product [Arabidopsis thaliana]|eukprot:NP_001323712.1 hypothetical protein AT2G41355 [Arabidopsis thaliana]